MVLSMLAGATLVAISMRPAALPIPASDTPAPPAGTAPVSPDRGDRAAEIVVAPSELPPPSVQDIIRGAFEPLGDGYVDWAQRIAFCESSYDPNAVNASSGASGLFQFLPSTWAGTPFAAASPFDPLANAQAAVWLLQTYGAGQWECRA